MTEYRRIGDTLHLQIDGSDGLRDVLALDEAHWVATTGPRATINADSTFLDLLDTDRDGRLRPEEIKDGIRFLLRYHNNPERIMPGNATLLLTDIGCDDELGQRIHGAATKVVRRVKGREDRVLLEDIRKVKQEVLDGGLDKAGIVLPEAARNEDELQLITDLLATVGGVEHPCGKSGLDAEKLEQFLAECRCYYQWYREAGEAGRGEPGSILPLGPKTGKAYQLFTDLSDKLIQYFLLCDIKRLNPEMLKKAMETPEANIALKLIDIREAEAYLKNAPLAAIDSGGELRLKGESNPYFRSQLKELEELVVQPLLGDEVELLDRQAFRVLQGYFIPYSQWLDKKPAVHIEGIEPEIIGGYATLDSYRQAMEELIAESYRTSIILENLVELERLVLYQGMLLPLVNSFVSFPHLYDPARRALFEMGTLVLDGRLFTLALKVEDRKHHKETAKNSNIFIMYLELFGDEGRKSYEIAVPVTWGSRGNIHLGKWGIFNDIYGRELHARVVDLVENPISVAEAMADPFMRIGGTFLARLEEFSAKTEEKVIKGELQKERKATKGSGGGWLAGGSIAAAALGSSFAFVTQTLAGLSLQVILVALAVTALFITVPIGVSTYYKLSRRDLSAILEGSGWGVNCRMRLTREQAATFTVTPRRN